MRGAPGATEGIAQVYLGVFSPTRGTYQLRVPGGALLSAPINGDFFGGNGDGRHARRPPGRPGPGPRPRRRVRLAADRPSRDRRSRSRWSRRSCDSRTAGSRARSPTPRHEVLQKPAVVLGGTVAEARRPGARRSGHGRRRDAGGPDGPAAVGQDRRPDVLRGRHARSATTPRRLYARHTIVDQLTLRPELRLHGPAPGRRPGHPRLGRSRAAAGRDRGPGPAPDRATSCASSRPTVAISGTTTFRSDLLRSTVDRARTRRSSARTRTRINFGRGSADAGLPADRLRRARIDGRPQLAIGLNFGGPGLRCSTPSPIEPLPTIPPAVRAKAPAEGCQMPNFDGLPEVELFDLTSRRLEAAAAPRPAGPRYAVADPARYVDPATGTVLVRFVNDEQRRRRLQRRPVDHGGPSNDRDRADRGPRQALRPARSPWPAWT